MFVIPTSVLTVLRATTCRNTQSHEDIAAASFLAWVFVREHSTQRGLTYILTAAGGGEAATDKCKK